jgi:signal transduction histidine kinase
MVSTTGRMPRSDYGFKSTRKLLARRRRNLLLPILLLVAVCLLAVAVLLYWSAQSLNERDALAQESLVASIVQTRKESLRQLVIDYAWWDDAIVSSEVVLDERWAKDGLPRYLASSFSVAAGWVISSDNRTLIAFEGGRSVLPHQAEALPRGSEELVAAARGATAIAETPQAGFVLYDQELALVSASLVAPLDGAAPLSASEHHVMVFLRPFDLSVFGSIGVDFPMEDVHLVRGPVPRGYLGCVITGIDGQPIGSLVWRDQRPGDELLWRAVPLLLISLLAVGILLYLAIRRVDTVVSREGRLSISLYQEQQRRSQKSHFVSMVSHELRTPLQAIGTAADMLERFGDQMTDGERREETTTIRRAVSTLARLVDDVLLIGRSDAAHNGGGDQPLDLAQFCQALWREVSLSLRSKQEMILHDRLGEPLKGVADTTIQPILSNLMQNAIKYSQSDEAVEVELFREGPHYVIAVTDFGPGIPGAQREAIFQPYWRAKEVDGITGTGLGLSVARSAARAIGGDLALDCSATARGTRFVLRWPVPI